MMVAGATEQDDGTIGLGAPEEPPIVELHGDASATPPSRRATELYHLAILLPTRRDLALALTRLAESRWPLDGASDHLVSEALYLSDPDGNGIEIYRDRPRDQWPGREGQIEMATLPLDLGDVLSELEPDHHSEARVPAGTTIGHVHLQAADLGEAEAFYSGVLGFDVMVRLYPQALFISAGGYHHHIGMNTWHSAGAPARRHRPRARSDCSPTRSCCRTRTNSRGSSPGFTKRAWPPSRLRTAPRSCATPSGNGVILRARATRRLAPDRDEATAAAAHVG